MYEVVSRHKPTVRILDAWIDEKHNRLHGIVVDYPENHNSSARAVVNGMEVTTSIIIGYNKFEDIIETRRTLYRVISWKRKPEKV